MSKTKQKNTRSWTKLGSSALEAEAVNIDPKFYSFKGQVVLMDNDYSLVPGSQYLEMITALGGRTVMRRTPQVTMFLSSKKGCQKRPVKQCHVITESDFWTLIGSDLLIFFSIFSDSTHYEY